MDQTFYCKMSFPQYIRGKQLCTTYGNTGYCLIGWFADLSKLEVTAAVTELKRVLAHAEKM